MNTIKQICFNPDTGRLILSDNDNNQYLCDIYGNHKRVFLPYVTGTITGAQRYKKKDLQLNLGKSNSQKDIQYFPTIRKLEGYSKFPRPLAPPFANRAPNEYSSSSKQKLIKALSKYFTSNESNHILNLPNDNKGLSYYTCDLNKWDISSVDTSLIIKLIDETIARYKEEYKYKINLLYKHPAVRALTNFRHVLIENKDMKIINGRMLPQPSAEIRVLSGCINKILHKPKLSIQSPKNMIQFSTVTSPKLLSPINIPKSLSNIALKEKEISFISEVDDQETIPNERELIRIKSTENITNDAERENKLLTGYIEPIYSSERLIRKFDGIKLRTNGELYLKNIDLMKRVNPIAYKLQENKDVFDLKQTQKKRLQRAINQMNVGFEFKK